MWVPPQIKVQQYHDSLRIDQLDRIQAALRVYYIALNHDRVVLKLNDTRSEALQVISNLKSEFHTYHHRERTLIDSLQKLHKDNKAQRDS